MSAGDNLEKEEPLNADDETDEELFLRPVPRKRKLTVPVEQIFKDTNDPFPCIDISDSGSGKRGSKHKKSKKSRKESIVYKNRVISIPINVDSTHSKRTRSFAMTDPDHRYRTFSEIVLVQHHPQYLRNISDFQFVKEIGHGGFGSVWLANDLRTGTECAIKELHTQELKGKVLTSYLREIHTMIAAQGRFVCPFIGYTIEPPYSIITKYMPGGNLSKAVRSPDKEKKKIKPKIYGTHLTIICMCIAHDMSHIHRCNIMHRDLKAGNILLDSDGLPRIIDFGVSRLMQTDLRHSMGIGTVSHMSPEVISTGVYDTKTDVFSYGILLYEVGEMRHAFRNANKHPKETSEEIVRGERPLFSPDLVPIPMKNLIARCWSQDPDERPTFEQIFQIFMEGRTFFKKSDPKKIVAFGQKLLREDAKRATMPAPPPPMTTVDTDAVIRRLTRKLTRKGPLRKTLIRRQNIETEKAAENIVEKMIQTPTIMQQETVEDSCLVVDVPMPIFSNDDKVIAANPNDPQFMAYIEYQVVRITPAHFNNLVKSILPVFTKPCKNTKQVLVLLKFMTDRNVDFLDKYSEYHLLPSLQLNEEYEEEFFVLLSQFFIKKPNLLNQTYTRLLAYFINRRPNDVICLFSQYVSQLEYINDPFPLLDFLMSYARIYLNISSGAKFIDLFHYLIFEYNEFKVNRFKNIKPIFTAFIRSDDKNVAYTAMKAVCSLYDDSFKLNLKILVSYLQDEKLYAPALALIAHQNELPPSLIFVQSIDAHCWRSKRATLILFKFALQSKECAEILTRKTNWMKVRSERTLKIFIEIFKYKNLRDSLMNTPEFPQMMHYLSSISRPPFIEAIALILKRININASLIDKLENIGFFKEIVTSASQCGMIGCIMMIIDVTSKIKFEPSYALFIPPLLNQLPLQNELTSAAIHTLTVLSFHKELKTILKAPVIINYFTALKQVESQKKYAVTFLNNLFKRI